MRGIEAACAPLVALHDSDDRMLPGRLQRQCDFLNEHADVTAVAGNMVFEGDETTNYLKSLGIVFDQAGTAVFVRPHERIVTKNFMANASSTFRRDAFLAAGGYDLSYRAVQDGEFWFRVARTWTLACIDHPCTWVRVHENSLSQSATALQCKLRLYTRELESNDLSTPQVRAQVARRLDLLAREFVSRSLRTATTPDWREVTRLAARHMSRAAGFRLALAMQLPPSLARWIC